MKLTASASGFKPVDNNGGVYSRMERTVLKAKQLQVCDKTADPVNKQHKKTELIKEVQKESLISEQYQNEIITAVKNEDDIVFITYSVLERTEERIKFALAKILEKYNRFDLFTPVYSCVKELISNATKANAKKILVLEGEIKDINDSEDIVKKVRSILNEKSLLEYGLKTKKYGLSTRVYLKVYKRHLSIEVINNMPLTKKEMDKINDRIKKSSKYDNIAAFFMENPDPEAEGMGLGLSMVVVLLKNINITHKNFAVTTNGVDKTYAKVLIPLS